MSFVIIIIGLMQFRNGPFIRPHPAFWRIVLAFGVIYELILVFIAFQVKLSNNNDSLSRQKIMFVIC